MYAVSHVIQPDDLAQIAFDSLRERICLLDRDGTIVLTNLAWSQSARENGAIPGRCGPGVNYLQVCRNVRGPFSERALEAASGIETVLRGAAAHFRLDYACPCPAREVWFRLTARPLHGLRRGAIIVHSEITGHVQVAEKLRRTEARCSAMWQSPMHAATVLALDGSIRYQSPACQTVMGIPAEEISGHSIYEFVHPDDLDAVRQLLRDCLRYPRRKHRCEYRFQGRSGSWHILESIASNLASQAAGGIILNSRDITHQKLAEKTLLAKQAGLVRSREDLEALAVRLFRDQEEERRRVSAQLNGSLSQRLASLSLQAAHLAARIGDPKQSYALEECVASLGRYLHDLSGRLHPATLEHLGLAVALRDYCVDFSRNAGVRVNYGHRGISSRLPVQCASTLYRIAEEALANVARHAHAKQAWVTLSRTAKGIRLSIRDDGAGFDPAGVAPGSGLGILAMRERLRAIKGSLSIRARNGAGTEVVALAPLTSAGNQPCAAIARNVVVDPLDQH